MAGHELVEFHQQMQIGCQPAPLKHDRGVEYILLRHERGALRGFLEAFYQLNMSKDRDMMGRTAPVVTVFVRWGKRFYGKTLELR
jgi:hypothetical protein